MLAYQIRLAWKSLRRNPVLSVLLVCAIGLGIAVSMTFVASYAFLSGNPIPNMSDRLFHVQVDGWNPQRPYDDDNPAEPPDQLTYRDATNLLASTIPTRQTVNFKAELTVHPAREGIRPYREDVRLCRSDFFPMFELPFAHGGPWNRDEDAGAQVVVLSATANQKLFGGENSVGRMLRLEDREFRVVGVLDRWRPLPKFYDTNNGPFDEPEEIYIPFGLTPQLRVFTSGNTSGWGNCGNDFEEFLQSECIWLQMWVQLDSASQRDEYFAWLGAYAGEQKKLGRFGRPVNNRLRDVMAWLRFIEVVPPEAKALLIISLLFLLVCAVNLIGILLGKFLARAPEVGVRRALGASRRWVFTQHIVECELVGLIGGLLGLALSLGGMRLIDHLFDMPFGFTLNLPLFGIGLGLSLLAALIAGAYPAWRICRIEPALHLKTQ